MGIERVYRRQKGHLGPVLAGNSRVAGNGQFWGISKDVAIVGQVCPLCGGRGGPVEGLPSRECCGILLSWQSWRWRSAKEYEAWYASTGAEYHDGEMRQTHRQPFVRRDTEYLITAASRLRKLREHYRDARTLLDVGAGTGAIVAQAGSWGFRATGIEPCPALVAWGQRMGRELTAGTWRDVAGQWDIITLFDVFEHLTDPAGCLEHLRKCAGVLVIEMPEYRAPAGDWTRHYKPAEHLCLYSVEAAIELFRRSGLRWDCIDRPLGGSLAKVVYYLRGQS